LTGGQRGISIVALVAAAMATALLTAPVSYHRLLFRMRRKAELVRAAGLLAVGSLVLLLIGMITATSLRR